MVIKLQKGGYISSRNYDTNLNQSFGNLLSMYKPDPIPDINANTQNILGVIQTNSNIYQNRQRLDLQRDEQALQAQVINLRIKDQENQMLKDNQDNFAKLLTMDDNVFLEADQKRFDEELKTDGLDDDTLANTLDFRDTDAIYKMMQKRTAKVSSYKNAFSNKQTYTNLTKELENLDKSINIGAVDKMGALDLNTLNQYQDDVLNLRNKIERIRYEGVNEITPEELAKLRSYNTKSFIDQNVYSQLQEIDKQTNAAAMKLKEADAYTKTIQAEGVQKEVERFKQIENPTQAQLDEYSMNIFRIQDPKGYATLLQKSQQSTQDFQEQIALANHNSKLRMNENTHATNNDIRQDSLKPITASGTADTYTNGTTTVEKGIVKGAHYGGVPHTTIEGITKTKIGTKGTMTATKAQIEKLYGSGRAKELAAEGVITQIGSSDNWILNPDDPIDSIVPPAGTTPTNPVITNKNPQPFTTVPQEGGRLSKFRK